MKKQLFLFLFAASALSAEPIQFPISGEAGLLMNADTGAILFEKNGHTAQYPASTTKVAVAHYILRFHPHDLGRILTADPDSLGTISPEAKRKSNYSTPSYWIETDGSHMGIKKGEKLSVKDLLEGMMIVSADDAANVLAQNYGPTIPGFMQELNAYLKSIGCKQTNFLNPHGLHHPEHVSTAYELALITREALKDPVFREIVAQPRFMRPKTNLQAAATYVATNRLLREGKLRYPKAIGVKTGYHSHAKSAFVGAAQSDGRTLIVVLLGYPDRKVMFEEAIKLFEGAFNQPKVHRTFLAPGAQRFSRPVTKGAIDLTTYTDQELAWDGYPSEEPQFKTYLKWDQLSPPIPKGVRVGEIQLATTNGKVLSTISLLSAQAVQTKWPWSWVESMPGFLRVRWVLITLCVGCVLIAFLATARLVLEK